MLLCFGSTSCSIDKKQRETDALLMTADSLYKAKKYDDAIETLSTLNKEYPKELKARQKALQLLREIKLDKSNEEAGIMSSMIDSLSLFSDSLFQKFELVEAKGMPDENILRYKGYDPTKASPKNKYLDVYVTSSGELELVAGNCRQKPLGGTFIKLEEAVTETFYTSEPIEYDGGLNYRFQDLGLYYERLTFTGKASEQIASFVNAHCLKGTQIKVTFGNSRGLSKDSFILSLEAKEAISTSYQYTKALKKISELHQAIEKHNKRVLLESERQMREKVKGLQ